MPSRYNTMRWTNIPRRDNCIRKRPLPRVGEDPKDAGCVFGRGSEPVGVGEVTHLAGDDNGAGR